MAKRKTRQRRGLGSAAQIKVLTTIVGRDVDANACGKAFDNIRALEYAIFITPPAQRDELALTMENAGAVRRHFAKYCLRNRRS